MKENRGEQKPIFYVNKTLKRAEIRYTTSEMIAVVVMTSTDLNYMLHKGAFHFYFFVCSTLFEKNLK